MDKDANPVLNEQVRILLEIVAREGVVRAAQGFAAMAGVPLTVSPPQLRLVLLSDVPKVLGTPEDEAVGIYLRMQGEMAGQIMLVLSYAKAMALVDLLADEPAGTTRELGSFERSTLGELGNLTASFFLTAVSQLTGLQARPSPPAVIVDMLGAILDVVVASYTGGEQVLLLQAAFLRTDGREVQADFWVIPQPEMLEAFAQRKWVHDH